MAIKGFDITLRERKKEIQEKYGLDDEKAEKAARFSMWEDDQRRQQRETDRLYHRLYVDGKPNYRAMAEEVLSRSKIITMRDNREMFYYNDGIYHQGVKPLVEECCKELSKDAMTTHQKNELLFQLRAMTYRDRKELEKNCKIIHLKNVIYNFEDHRTQEFSPDIFATAQLPVEYDSAADCPKIKEFVAQVCPQDYEVVQQLFGYCLWRGYPFQKGFMMHGDGANGKSTLLNLLQAFLGEENCSSVSLQQLCYNKFAPVRLYGRLVNVYDDLSDRALQATGMFKMLTGGGRIPGEKKGKQDSFDFLNHAKLVFSANKLPEVVDDTDAFFRRWVIIKFPMKFEGDDAKPEDVIMGELTTPDELSGCFNWAVEGLKSLFAQGGFAGSTEEMREQYIKGSDSLKAFVLECVEYGGDEYITKEDFYNRYVDYCNENSLLIKPKVTVGRQLPQHIRTEEMKASTPGGRKVAWNGIRFVTHHNDMEVEVSEL